jgi:hypothetical protein
LRNELETYKVVEEPRRAIGFHHNGEKKTKVNTIFGMCIPMVSNLEIEALQVFPYLMSIIFLSIIYYFMLNYHNYSLLITYHANSIWELETFYRKREIVIIGSGFSGLWTAISIKEKHPEKSVLIIERNAVPLGASTRNAGFACFGSLTEVIADSQKMGWEKHWTCYNEI